MTPTLSICHTDWADKTIALPSYATDGSAGMDLRANFPPNLRKLGVIIQPNMRTLIPTGLCVAMPYDMEATARPRSGFALKNGITVLNSPGTIDADYRGEWGVIVINHGANDFHIPHGKRFAQVVFSPIIRPKLVLVEDLPKTARGDGGIGSTN